MRTEGSHKTIAGIAGRGARLLASVGFEMALLCLLLLTAGALVWKDALLERTVHFTPQTAASKSHLVFSDGDTDGKSIVRDTGGLSWNCDLRAGNAYPYCGYELFTDKNRGTHGLNLSNMRSFAITMMYSGPSTSFRVHIKNFDPHYSDRADDESPKYLRVEADTTPGKWQRTEFVPSDFGVADWWLRKRKLPPEFGRPQFDDITSIIIETGSEAPLGRHAFAVRDIAVRTAVLSDAQWYSLLLGIWIVMIVLYLGYRIGNLKRALKERQMLEALALREAREAASRDPLTSLLNRRGLNERFETLIRERRHATSLAVILIDIDHFKNLNDTYGHDRGDQVLAAFAGVIGRNIRGGDMAARWGGEEFIVVCADVDRRNAQRIAEKLRACVEIFDFGIDRLVTASFGIHVANVHDPELAPLVALADKALYQAKAEGRNCCRMYRPPAVVKVA